LKDSQKGKSCIIIGNGPSLQIEDLEKIYESNVISFGLNQINQIYENTVWRPDYFVLHDYGFLSKFSNQSEVDNYIKEIQDEQTKKVFLNSKTPKRLRSIINKKILFFRIPIQKLNSKHLPQLSSDISLKIEDYGTVTSSAIQIALYMGITKIYLIGQDFTYKEYIDIDGNYILDKKAKDYVKGLKGANNFSKYNCPDLRTAFRGFKKIKKYAEDHGVEIVNVTRGGNLDIFERASFEDVFDNSPNT
jgi:hypothetical protein